MRDYPANLAPAHEIEPAPRRLRGMLGGQVVFETTHALYVWEATNYPTYYVPLADIDPRALVDEAREQHTRRGPMSVYGLRVGQVDRPSSVRVPTQPADAALEGMARIDWRALDAWFEEDEEVFVHPRNPYVRVDVLRSTRRVRIELDGVVLAESSSPLMLFETGLPTRYYLDQGGVRWEFLERSDSVTRCPYKGTTGRYWSARIGENVQTDLAWSYTFTTRDVLPIAGLVAFYNERVDTYLDDELLERPLTHFA